MNWDDLRYLIAIIENKTASAAAKKMGVNYVTVCRRIERLEYSLKQKLIFFKDNKYYPTNEGKYLYKKALDISLSLADMEDELSVDQHLKKTITISSSASVAAYLLISGFKNILNKHPQIKINFSLTPHINRLHTKECDIAIRHINSDREYGGDLLCSINYNLCCSESYMKNDLLDSQKLRY